MAPDGDGGDDEDVGDDADAAEVALTDSLDLHTFKPSEVADVVEEYVRAAHEAGMRAVRVVHGKGNGTLRRIVHGVLAKHPAVARYALDDGNWGATVVALVP